MSSLLLFKRLTAFLPSYTHEQGVDGNPRGMMHFLKRYVQLIRVYLAYIFVTTQARNFIFAGALVQRL